MNRPMTEHQRRALGIDTEEKHRAYGLKLSSLGWDDLTEEQKAQALLLAEMRDATSKNPMAPRNPKPAKSTARNRGDGLSRGQRRARRRARGKHGGK